MNCRPEVAIGNVTDGRLVGSQHLARSKGHDPQGILERFRRIGVENFLIFEADNGQAIGAHVQVVLVAQRGQLFIALCQLSGEVVNFLLQVLLGAHCLLSPYRLTLVPSLYASQRRL